MGQGNSSRGWGFLPSSVWVLGPKWIPHFSDCRHSAFICLIFQKQDTSIVLTLTFDLLERFPASVQQDKNSLIIYSILKLLNRDFDEHHNAP